MERLIDRSQLSDYQCGRSCLFNMISGLFSRFSTVQVCILAGRNQINVMITIPGVDDEDVDTEVISFQRCLGLLSGQRAVKLEGREGADRLAF